MLYNRHSWSNENEELEKTWNKPVYFPSNLPWAYPFFLTFFIPNLILLMSLQRSLSDSKSVVIDCHSFSSYGGQDINVTQVVGELRKVVTQPLMDQDSALVLNAGVHLLKSTSFRNYQKVIKGFIRLLRGIYRGKVIWKTTPSLGKQTELYTGCSRRFHTEQVMKTGKASFFNLGNTWKTKWANRSSRKKQATGEKRGKMHARLAKSRVLFLGFSSAGKEENICFGCYASF